MRKVTMRKRSSKKMSEESVNSDDSMLLADDLLNLVRGRSRRRMMETIRRCLRKKRITNVPARTLRLDIPRHLKKIRCAYISKKSPGTNCLRAEKKLSLLAVSGKGI